MSRGVCGFVPQYSCARVACPSEAERDEAACNYLARPGFARQWTAIRKEKSAKEKRGRPGSLSKPSPWETGMTP